MKHTIAVILFLFAVISAWADDGAIWGVGGSIATMKAHPSVRMVRETVRAKITKYRDMNGYEAKVHCRFEFRNGGPATVVKMGFPSESSGAKASMAGTPNKDFRSWVDGVLVQTKFTPEVRREHEYKPQYMDWYVKDVSFAAGQTRIVEDVYSCELGSNVDGIQRFCYILRTGSSWKGNIADVLITVDASDAMAHWRVVPDGYGSHCSKRGGIVTWHMRNLEPEDTIGVTLIPKYIVVIGSSPVAVDEPRNAAESANYTMPARELEQHLFWGDSTSSWNARTRSWTVDCKPHRLRLSAGSRKAVFDGKTHRLPIAPFVLRGELHVPVLAVAKIMGMKVSRIKKGERDYLTGCYWIDVSSWNENNR